MKVGNHNVTPDVESEVTKDTERPANKYSPYSDIRSDWEKQEGTKDEPEDASN